MNAYRIAVAALLTGIAIPSSAAGPSPEAAGRDALLEALAPSLAARGATATVQVTPLDPRRALAHCARVVGYLPPGARLAGRTSVGIRCVDGANWQTLLSADVRIEAPVWQAVRPLRPGDTIGSADVVRAVAALTTADLDAARSRGMASIDGRQPAPIGRVAQRAVPGGRALAAGDLRDDGRINAGDAVRVVYQGAGFTVSSEGRSVGAADTGANVVIRLASGALVNGIVRADHRVDLPR